MTAERGGEGAADPQTDPGVGRSGRSARMARMLPDGRRLGAHLPLGGGMVKAVERAHAIGANALQVFGDNPTAWRRRAEPPKEQPAFREKLRELDIGPVAVHAAYLVNLAGRQADFFERSVEVLKHDVDGAPGFGAQFVNVHAGSHRGAGRILGAAYLAEGVHRVLSETDGGPDAPLLVIENSAGGGDTMGSTLEELAEIAEAIAGQRVAPARVGFCLDAAHAWGAGYRISEPDEVDALVERFDALIGLDRLAMVHLNDTRSGLGSRTDRHEHIGAGQIGEAGLRRLLVQPRLAGVTYILETPGMEDGYDAVNVGRALDLAAGRSLAPLPPEAFELRRDSSRVAPAEAADEPDDARANPQDGAEAEQPAPAARPRPRRDASLRQVLSDRRTVGGVPARELLGLVAILAVAAVLRFIDLPGRGQWEADQGHDMLVLYQLTQLGQWPLVGPPTSIGDFHHGVLYYYVLAPAAWLSAADPVAVTAEIALAGVAAVAVTWWLARSIGGPIAGLVAGALMAVSASAVEESTFIWNPNLVPLASAIAFAGAWRAWSADEARPIAWIVAFGGAIATMHFHVLGVILAPAIVAPWILDVRRRSGAERRRLLLAGAAGIGLLLLSYVPLAIQLASTDFGEVRSAIGVRDGRRRAVGDEPPGPDRRDRPAGAGVAAHRPADRRACRRDPRRGGRRRGDRLAVHRGVGQ